MKKYLFLQNIHYLRKKMFLYEKKVLEWKKSFTDFYREKYKWKCKKLYLISQIYFYTENVWVKNKI